MPGRHSGAHHRARRGDHQVCVWCCGGAVRVIQGAGARWRASNAMHAAVAHVASSVGADRSPAVPQLYCDACRQLGRLSASTVHKRVPHSPLAAPSFSRNTLHNTCPTLSCCRLAHPLPLPPSPGPCSRAATPTSWWTRTFQRVRTAWSSSRASGTAWTGQQQ